jgi:hypothetical protein
MQKYNQITHSVAIGKLLAYNINQETYLRIFLYDGNVTIITQSAEDMSQSI